MRVYVRTPATHAPLFFSKFITHLLIEMATVSVTCNGCDFDPWLFIKNFHSENEAFLDYLKAHGVLPTSVTCPNCEIQCRYRTDRHQFVCDQWHNVAKTKRRRRCNYSVSLYKGTFLDKTHLPPWEIGLFINHWLLKKFDHDTILKCLHWSMRTSIDWRSFCSEVTLSWLNDQEPIGGIDIIVEIDETFFVKAKYGRGRELRQIWVFGGIERVSKKKFIVPLHKEGQDRSARTLIPLIKKYIRPGSIVISDGWAAYNTVGQEGYTHKVINHSEQFVDTNDPVIHTQTIERAWRDLKEWVKRPGLRTDYFEQYFGRYLFIDSFPNNSHHHFFLEAGKLYPPHGARERPSGQEDLSESEEPSASASTDTDEA